VRAYLRRLAADPELVERHTPPALRIDGARPTLEGLSVDAAALAATALAAERGYEVAVVERATERMSGDDRVGRRVTAFVTADDRETAFERLARAVRASERGRDYE
jgi:hypothetical protein